MFEVEREPRTFVPIKLDILNLVNTQSLDNVVPMCTYPLVTNKVIASMDTIATSVKDEINRIMVNREKYFCELRLNE